MKKPTADNRTAGKADAIERYAEMQVPGQGAICRLLRAEIDAALPDATSRVWHGSPVWFVGENPVVGYSVTAKKGVSLLFWNGLAFGDPGLEAVGAGGRAGQIRLTAEGDVDTTVLRRWLQRAGREVFDSVGHFRAQRAAAKRARR